MKRGNYKLGDKAYRLLYDTRNPHKYILTRTRSNAKVRGIECTIELEDIIIPEYCPILGVKLDKVRSSGIYAPSLDRKNNTLGYVPGNVFVISNRANTLKSNMSLEQVEALYNYLSS